MPTQPKIHLIGRVRVALLTPYSLSVPWLKDNFAIFNLISISVHPASMQPALQYNWWWVVGLHFPFIWIAILDKMNACKMFVSEDTFVAEYLKLLSAVQSVPFKTGPFQTDRMCGLRYCCLQNFENCSPKQLNTGHCSSVGPQQYTSRSAHSVPVWKRVADCLPLFREPLIQTTLTLPSVCHNKPTKCEVYWMNGWLSRNVLLHTCHQSTYNSLSCQWFCRSTFGST